MIFRKLGKENKYSKHIIVNLRKIFPLGNVERIVLERTKYDDVKIYSHCRNEVYKADVQ